MYIYTQFLTSIVSLTAALFSAFLAYFMLKQGTKNPVRFSFSLLLVSVAFWLFFYTIWLWQVNPTSAFIFARILMVGAVFTYPTLLHFVIRFSQISERKARFILVVAYSSAVIFSFSSLFTNYFIQGVEEKVQYEFWPVRGGIFFDLYTLTWVIVSLFSVVSLYGVFRKASTSMLKAQAKLVFSGLLIGLVGGATNFFLWYDIKIPPYGNIVIPLYLFMIFYAIIKYRFADIKVVIKRSLIFAIIVLLITVAFSGSSAIFTNFLQRSLGSSSTLWSGILTGIIVAVAFEPIKKLLTRLTDSFLFKGEYNADELLSKLSNDFSSSLNLKNILKTSSGDLAKAFRIVGISVYLFDKEKNTFEEKYFEGNHIDTLSLDKKEIDGYLRMLKPLGLHASILVTDELRRNEAMNNTPPFKALVDRLEKYEVAVSVPLYVKNELIGFYFLGPKKSGDVFSSQDIRVLDIMSGQAATAIENAALYEQQKHFAEILQAEVEKKTKELQHANKELKKLDLAKSEFISIASHQLRTPMTVIKGYMSMIKSGDFGPVSDKLQKPVESVTASTQRLLALIEDLLNISRIESGRMQFEFGKVNLTDLVTSVYDELSQNAKKKNLEFKLVLPEKRVADVVADQAKIREVVMNLADNAIKYTDSGTVTLILEQKGNEVKYTVKDTGRGMTKEDIGKLFKKFSRVGSAQLVHTEGTGLGLYIAKQIIKKHKGKIWADSEGMGKGSLFALALKIKNPYTESLLKHQEEAKKDVEKKKDMYQEDTIDMSRIKPGNQDPNKKSK